MKKTLLTVTAVAALLFSCSSDDDPAPVVENPEEVITNVNITLVNADDDTDVIILSLDDEDGIGLGEAGVITGGTLTVDTVYIGAITLTNELADDDEEKNVTAEILELAEDHQFFFIPEFDLDLFTSYTDEDEDGNPVGLSFTLNTTDASSGGLNVVLRHEPNKDADGVSQGDITNEDQGESDFDIVFPITIVAANTAV